MANSSQTGLLSKTLIFKRCFCSNELLVYCMWVHNRMHHQYSVKYGYEGGVQYLFSCPFLRLVLFSTTCQQVTLLAMLNQLGSSGHPPILQSCLKIIFIAGNVHVVYTDEQAHKNKNKDKKNWISVVVVVVHTFSPSTWKAKASGSLSSRPV